jgi:hypothetical protein
MEGTIDISKHTESTVDISKLLEKLKCPLSKKIFRIPVAASDGIIYEQHFIDEHTDKNGLISPITHQPIQDKCLYFRELKVFIDELSEVCPEIEKNRSPNCKFKLYSNFNQMLSLKKYNELSYDNVPNYSKITSEEASNLLLAPDHVLINIMKCQKDKTLLLKDGKYINQSIVGFACLHAFFDKAILLVNLGADINYTPKNSNSPLVHLIYKT